MGIGVHKAFYEKYTTEYSYMRKQCVPGLSSGGRGMGTRLKLTLTLTEPVRFEL